MDNYQLILNKIQEYHKSLQTAQELDTTLCFENSLYIGIMKNGEVTSPSLTPYVFEGSAEYGIIITIYRCRRSEVHRNFFAAFIQKGSHGGYEINEQCKMNGWKLSFSYPELTTTYYQTMYRYGIVSKDSLTRSFRIEEDDHILRDIMNCIKLFIKAQNCTTQEELNQLKI